MRRLIRVFAGRTCNLVENVVPRFISIVLTPEFLKWTNDCSVVCLLLFLIAVFIFFIYFFFRYVDVLFCDVVHVILLLFSTFGNMCPPVCVAFLGTIFMLYFFEPATLTFEMRVSVKDIMTK